MNPRKLSRLIRRSIEALKVAGYNCSPAQLGPWQIVGLSSTDCVLVYISDCWPVKPWIPDQLKQVAAPANAKRIIHYWPARARLPRVTEIS